LLVCKSNSSSATNYNKSTAKPKSHVSHVELSMRFQCGRLSKCRTNWSNQFLPTHVCQVWFLRCCCCKVEQLLEKSDQKRFSALQNPEHCIYTLLPPSKDSDRSLRPRCHNYQLPVVTRKIHIQSFIPRFLFKYV